MPSVSQAQQRFFGWLKGNPEEAKREGVGKGLTAKQIDDFASTPRKGLPERKSKKRYYREK